jgi:beta-galactosidase
VDQHNKVQNFASYLHRDYLACARKWYQAVFGVLAPRQITRGGKIILVQLDNEMGMLQWVRNIMDTNPDTAARFAAYVQRTVGRDLPNRYPADPARLAEFLRDGLLDPREPYGARIVEDYRRFYREYLCEYAAWLHSEAIANGLEVPAVLNIHGFANGGKTFPIGLSQLILAMGLDGMISATDVYPGIIGEGSYHELLLVNEMTKALQNPEQALFSIEFQSGGHRDFSNTQSSLYDLHSRLCLASGMRAINHYLFFGGQNDPVLSPVKRHDWGPPVRQDGTVRSHYARYGRLSRALRCYGADLVRSRPQAVTTLGFLLDYFMTEVNNACTQERTNILVHQREVVLFDMLARGLALSHRPFDAVDVVRGDLDPERMPVLWLMLEKACPAETQRKLVEYVRRGGRLILAGRMCTADFDQADCTILKDALGISAIRSDPPFAGSPIQAFSHRDVPVSFVESYAGEFDDVIATRENGEVVGFIQTLGAGRVMMLGAAFRVETLEDLDVVHQMALKMDCPPLFTVSDWADVRLSRSDNGSFLFVNNYQDDPVQARIEVDGEPLLGGNPVVLPARRGAILPIEWRLSREILIHYITSEVVDIVVDDATTVIRTDPERFVAELTLSDYRCDGSARVRTTAEGERIRVQGNDGVIVLTRDG